MPARASARSAARCRGPLGRAQRSAGRSARAAGRSSGRRARRRGWCRRRPRRGRATCPWWGQIRPAMKRSSVDLPEPERPSKRDDLARADIEVDPLENRQRAPSGMVKVLATWSMIDDKRHLESWRARRDWPLPIRLEREAGLGQAVEARQKKTVDRRRRRRSSRRRQSETRRSRPSRWRGRCRHPARQRTAWYRRR